MTNGQRHFRTEVVASDMIILGPRDRNKLSSNNSSDGYSGDKDFSSELIDKVDDVQA